MNEQEKEFMAFVEWLPKNVKKFANATPEEIVTYLTKLSETPEGKNEFNALVTEYKKSKSGNVPMNKKGGKIEYFVQKFFIGGGLPKHHKDLFNRLTDGSPSVTQPVGDKGHTATTFRYVSPHQPNDTIYVRGEFNPKGRLTGFTTTPNNGGHSEAYAEGARGFLSTERTKKELDRSRSAFTPRLATGGPIDNDVEKNDTLKYVHPRHFGEYVSGTREGHINTIGRSADTYTDRLTGDRYEQTYENGDTARTVNPGGDFGKIIDVNSGRYSDVYGNVRGISKDSINMFRERFDKIFKK